MLDIQAVQRWRKLAIFAGLPLLVAATTFVRAVPVLEHPVEHLCLVAIMICVIGRAWCSLYIGGRKTREIVSTGPYLVSRNPLYVFTFIGAFGVGAQTGSLTVGAIFSLAAWIVFRLVVAREEQFLGSAFGKTYQDYRARVPRFWPDLRRWSDPAELNISPRFFMRTVLDGAVFLLALPVFEGLEHLQQIGWLDTLYRLP